MPFSILYDIEKAICSACIVRRSTDTSLGIRLKIKIMRWNVIRVGHAMPVDGYKCVAVCFSACGQSAGSSSRCFSNAEFTTIKSLVDYAMQLVADDLPENGRRARSY